MLLPTLDRFPKSVLAKIDIQRAFAVSRVIIAAERLQVFRLLSKNRLSAAMVGKRLKIHTKFAAPYLNALVSLGLLKKQRGVYWNSEFAGKYFVAERPIEWTRRYSAECIMDYAALAALERTLESGAPKLWEPGRKNLDYVESMKRNPQEASDFTQMLFHLHQPEAEALAGAVNLSGYRTVLDAGGGSGVMSIAIAQKNRHLKLTVLDIESVCRIARRNIRSAGLASRVRTMAGNLNSKLPVGFDVIMFCDIGAVTPALLKRAYSALEPGGLLIVADSYLNDGGTDPLDRLLSNFGESSFGLATGREMLQQVRDSGFTSVRARKALRELWIITGKKESPKSVRATSDSR